MIFDIDRERSINKSVWLFIIEIYILPPPPYFIKVDIDREKTINKMF